MMKQEAPTSSPGGDSPSGKSKGHFRNSPAGQSNAATYWLLLLVAPLLVLGGYIYFFGLTLPGFLEGGDAAPCSFEITLGKEGLWEGPWGTWSLPPPYSEGDKSGGGGADLGLQATGGEGAAAAAAAAAGGGSEADAEAARHMASFYRSHPAWAYWRGEVVKGWRLVGPRDEGLGVTGGNRSSAAAERRLLQGLEAGSFDVKDPLTLAFARLVDMHLLPWVKFPGVETGIGRRGIVKPQTLKAMATNDRLAGCCAQIRVVGGKVYWRYGSFLNWPLRLRRINLSVRMIQDAIDTYDLRDLRAEFYINACNQPIGFDNSLAPNRAGYPVFSTQVPDGSTDIGVPDPLDLDLTEDELAVHRLEPSWHQKKTKAFFRGVASNFALKEGNYGVSPRVRLHFMSDVRPDLLDARITAWGGADSEDARLELIEQGFEIGFPLPAAEVARYKYSLVPDDAVGTTRTCAALNRKQVPIRQVSAYAQFYEPLLLPGVHFAKTKRSFGDLFDLVEWLRTHDVTAHQIVRNANQVAPWICTWNGRTLYWAVLISKYASQALEDPSAVTVPNAICNGPALQHRRPPGRGQLCVLEGPNWESVQYYTNCTDFCVKGVPVEDWKWLSSDSLGEVERMDPFHEEP